MQRFALLPFTGDDASTGNFGLLDQAMALQWVRNNIEGTS